MAGDNRQQITKKRLDHDMLGRQAFELNFSTYEVARRSGVPQPTVSAVFLGKQTPAADKLKAICDVLNLDMNDVFVTVEPERLAA